MSESTPERRSDRPPSIRTIPLHISILSVFIVITGAITAFVVGYGYWKNSSTALEEAHRLLGEVSSKVFERTVGIYENLATVTRLITSIPDVSTKPDGHQHPLAPLLMGVLESDGNITSAYLGYEDGDFYQIFHLREGQNDARSVLGAPPEASFAIQSIARTVSGQRTEAWTFLDGNRQVIASKAVQPVQYDPRRRVWYQTASASDATIVTDFYVFATLREVGVSAARRFDGEVSGVFAMDLALSSVSRFLAEQALGEDSQIVMFHKGGAVTAFPDTQRLARLFRADGEQLRLATIDELEEPVLTALFERFVKGGSQSLEGIEFNVEGRNYVGRIAEVAKPAGDVEFLAVAVPVEEFVGAIAEAGRQSLVFSLVVFALFVPLVVWVARRISRPLEVLVVEAQAIRDFQLESPVLLRSRINEVDNLAAAMGAMKGGLVAFGRYVPKALVRRMVQSDIVPELGGERKPLTLFFTDVANFTTLADTLSPEELERKVSRYFQDMGSVILGCGGTIDKYIGDSIMAFWNAPVADSEHMEHACLAALRCQALSNRLNEEWAGAGSAIMYTRFGLHSGDVIVGNFGSSDRMEYTAMGAVVNLASRLEGLNKYYGTQILVSEAIALGTSDRFLFRSVDLATPRGALSPVGVFELRGARAGCEDLPLEQWVDAADEAYCMRWDQAVADYRARRWEHALRAFEDLRRERGDDELVRIYVDRTTRYRTQPPPEGWSGVEEFLNK